MTTLHELAAMLDRATGPSRELNAAISFVMNWEGQPTPWSASIDAALALVERMLPDVKWAKNFGGWFILYGVFNGNFVALGSSQAHDVPFPLAILRSLVAALIAQENTNEA